MVHSQDQIYLAFLQEGMPPDKAAVGAAISMAESGGNDKIVHHNSNGTIDQGVMQINSVHNDLFGPKQLGCNPLDFSCNIKAAIVVSNMGRDWSPWVQYNNGAYKKFIGHKYALTPAQQKAISDKGAAAIPTENIGGYSGPIGQAITGAADAVSGTVSAVPDFLKWVTDPSSWLRIGKGGLGVIFVATGVGAMVFVIGNKAKSTPIGHAIQTVK